MLPLPISWHLLISQILCAIRVLSPVTEMRGQVLVVPVHCFGVRDQPPPSQHHGRCLAACRYDATRRASNKMPREKLVVVDHVGGEQQVVVREQVWSETHIIRVVFHDFANLPHIHGKVTRSFAALC
jgi:hypothetical protein